jgi:hypothetical protein
MFVEICVEDESETVSDSVSIAAKVDVEAVDSATDIVMESVDPNPTVVAAASETASDTASVDENWFVVDTDSARVRLIESDADSDTTIVVDSESDTFSVSDAVVVPEMLAVSFTASVFVSAAVGLFDPPRLPVSETDIDRLSLAVAVPADDAVSVTVIDSASETSTATDRLDVSATLRDSPSVDAIVLVV